MTFQKTIYGVIFSALFSSYGVAVELPEIPVEPMKSEIMTKSLNLANATEKDVIEWRRYFHQNPELPWQEKNTRDYIVKVLKTLPGVEIQTGIAKYGVKAVIKGAKTGPVVALRADIDALPLKEETDLPFKSTKTAVYNGVETNVTHACGHDAHTAMLLGAAKVFSELRNELPGTVVLIFQPAEEGGPGNGGALPMIEQGVLNNPKVDVVLGQHVSVDGKQKSVGVLEGDLLAGANNFIIKLKGQGGHGSVPWTANDPIIASAEVIQGLQSIISHQIDQSAGQTTLTVGYINSGLKTNILPDTSEMGGTIRSLSRENLKKAKDSLVRKVNGVASAWNLKADLNVSSGGYDNTWNDIDATRKILPGLSAAAGTGNLVKANTSMASDDFGAFGASGTPAVYWRLYAPYYKDKENAPNHSPAFKIDEGSLVTGTRALVGATLSYMTAKGKNQN